MEGDKKQQSINSCHEKWAHEQNKSMLFKQGRTKLKPNHEPLLLDSLVQIKLWKSLKLIFLENSFNKDKSVGL